MTIIIEPPPQTLDGIFRQCEFEVPDLQRDFSWTKDQLEKFWEDSENIFDDDLEEYFFGPMVFVKPQSSQPKSSQPKSGPFTIIDGQQRLIIISILVACGIDILAKDKSKNQMAISELNSLLFRKTYLGKPTDFILTLNDNNERFFKDNILKESDPDNKIKNAKPLIDTNKKLLDAYKFFKKQFEEKGITENLDTYIPEYIQKIMVTFLVIKIIVPHEEAGHRVFETLNYRGLDLSISNLVKNFLLEKSQDRDLSSNLGKWKIIADTLDHKGLDAFLKHHWVAHYEIATPATLYDKIKKEIDSAIKVNSLLDELMTDAKIYIKLRKPLTSFWYNDQDVVDYLNELNDLRNDSAQPLLIVAKRYWDDKNNLRELAKACSTIHFRAKSIGHIPASNMVGTMAKTAEGLRKNKKNYTMKDVLKEFKKIDIVPTLFESNFKESTYSGKEASYVLRKIESYRNGSYTVTQITKNANLEHILPQTLNQSWNHFSTVEHQKYVGKIGNLTILHKRLNVKARNFSFNQKKSEYQKQQGQIKITDDLLKKNNWTMKEIDDRTEDFCKDAVKIWPSI